MSLARQHELDRRLRSVFPRDDRPTASALLGHSNRLLDAAQDLQRQAGRQRASGDDDGAVAAIECLAPTLEAIANASLLLSLHARDLLSRDGDAIQSGGPRDGGNTDAAEHAARLLFGASQNIRIAAEASRLTAEAVRPASPSAA